MVNNELNEQTNKDKTQSHVFHVWSPFETFIESNKQVTCRRRKKTHNDQCDIKIKVIMFERA